MAKKSRYYEEPPEEDWARLVNKPELGTAMERIAGKGMRLAETLSLDFTDTGEYLESFDIQRSLAFFRGEPRNAVDLANTCDHALLVELKHHVLSRVLGSLGVL